MSKLGEKIISNSIKCSHCGDVCTDNALTLNDLTFCCAGCQLVYTFLAENGLCNYYTIDSSPGTKQVNKIYESKYDYLDEADVISSLSDFSDERISTFTFYIPSIHCSSCIWLLEKLPSLNAGIVSSKINFPRKEVSVSINKNLTSLKETVILLAKTGYEPQLGLDALEKKKISKEDKSLYIKLGVAAFCFGNVMLLSFPEYLSTSGEIDHGLKNLFGLMMFILSLPVITYSASGFFISAYNGIRSKVLNIDIPLALGIAVLFLRSAFEILFTSEAGFTDSMTGLVFFLLLGKVFQNKTFNSLNFERNYKSYFPISVSLKEKGKEKSIPLSRLKIFDRIIVRNDELIPADSILTSGKANIDYSFVTGESEPVTKIQGDLIYAGGRQKGSAIEVETVKEVSQSYLTKLWNEKTFSLSKNENNISLIANKISRYFTPSILLIAFTGALIWLPAGFHKMLDVFTAILIVACPCALALSIPFTLGNSMRILGRNKFYVKNTSVIENMSYIDSIVFDKTGTITKAAENHISFSGEILNKTEQAVIKSLARNSRHPHSVKIFKSLESDFIYEVVDFKEIPGKGLEGKILGYEIKLGSEKFVNGDSGSSANKGTKVFVSIDGQEKGYFLLSNYYRKGLKDNLSLLDKFKIHLLSGDNDNEKSNLKNYFGKSAEMHFNMSALDKLQYIKHLQSHYKKVLMVGDGLNDSGALKQSDIGISVSENINNFIPASDGILEGKKFEKLASLIAFSKDNMTIIKTSFILSVFYNVAGLSLALQGLLNPLFAAILMPLSSVTIVSFAVFATSFTAKRRGLN